MPIRDYVTPERLKRWGKVGGAAFLTALVSAFLAAYFTAGFQRDINNESALQQQRLAALQQFVTTGAELDASVTYLSDSIIDAEQIDEARREVRTAIAAHASASESLKEIVGDDNMDAYMEGLGTLREFVDGAENPSSMMDASQARFDVMSNRNLIVDEARRVIYS